MHCYNPASGCDMTGLILPIAEYDHSLGNAVIGGLCTRAARYQALAGAYIFSDNSSGTVWKLEEEPARDMDPHDSALHRPRYQFAGARRRRRNLFRRLQRKCFETYRAVGVRIPSRTNFSWPSDPCLESPFDYQHPTKAARNVQGELRRQFME